jgi:hypothetical protein
MAKITAAEYAEKHARRLKGSTEDIRRGVSRVTVAPTASAAGKIDKMKANLDRAFSEGRVKSGLLKVSLDDWQKAMTDKGLGRISAGIDAVQGKQVQMAERLLAAVDSAAGKVRSMPDITLDDSINRMTAFVREMSKSKGKI